MRAQQVVSLDGPGAVQAADVPVPEPAGDQLLIDVAATGVAFPDLLMTRGLYQVKPPLPFIPGVEVAGTVRSAPAGAGFSEGDRVIAVTMLGGFGEVVAASPALTIPLPSQLSAEQGAALVMNYHTAYFSLIHRAQVRRGETVAVHGAAGGLGSATVQLAHALGATVVALTSTAEKAEVARRAGADILIDSGGEWPAELRAVNNGKGADVIVDPVGGDRFDESLRCLAPAGRLVVVGFTEGRIPTVAVNRLLLRNISVVGAAWGAWLGGHPQLFAEITGALAPLIESGAVAPIIGASLPLDRAADALRLLEDRAATGKVVLTV